MLEYYNIPYEMTLNK